MSKHVLVTGSSTGIGRACALHLAERGWIVHAGVRKAGDGESLKRDSAGAVRGIVVDITEEASVAAAAREIESRVGSAGLSGLVNNAGTCVAGPVETVSMGEWRRQFEVNFFGHIAVTQAMLPLLRIAAESGHAAVVMMSSIAGRIGQPTLGPYCASKFAMEAMADALRCEVAGQGIRVSILEPGAIRSEIWRKAIEDGRRGETEQPERYRVLVKGVARLAEEAEKRAIPAAKVAREVERCLTLARPPIRRLIGMDARMSAWMVRVMPRGVFDRLIVKVMTRAGRAES